MLDLAQLLRVPQVHPQFDSSPDDTKLAFAWNKTGEWQIYDMDLDTSSAPKPVTVGIVGKFNPRCPASDSMDARDKLVELEKVSISFCMKTKAMSS